MMAASNYPKDAEELNITETEEEVVLLYIMKQYLRICWLRLKWWLGFKLTTNENSDIAYWITRNVITPPGLNAHDVCEMEWERLEKELKKIRDERELVLQEDEVR